MKNAGSLSGINTNLRISQDVVLASMNRAVTDGTLAQDDADLVFWFYSHAQAARMSLDDAGAALDASSTSVFQLLMGRGAGGQMIDRVRALKKRVEEVAHAKEDTGFIETSTWHKIRQVCDYVSGARKPAFIYGESQIGKTTCLEHWRASQETGKVYLLTMPVAPTLSVVVYELAKMLHIPPKGLTAEIRSRVYDAVDSRFVFIVDESHQAMIGGRPDQAVRVMEFLRSIHDRCKCGVVFAGTNVFKREIEQGALSPILDQFRRRSIVSLVLPAQTPRSDLDKIAEAYHMPPILTDKTAEDIVMRMVRNSGIGQFIAFLKSAENVAAKLKQPISWSHFIAAYDLVASLSTQGPK